MVQTVTEQPDEVLPWEVQDGETPRAFAAFVVYRDLGPRRSLRKTARVFYELGDDDVPPTSPKLRQLKTWSALYGWVGRAHAWDVHMDEETRWDQVEAVREMKKRHATVANMALAKAAERLRVANAQDLSIVDAARLIDLAVKVERVARGEPDQVKAVTGVEGGPAIAMTVDAVSVDALESRLRALLNEAAIAEDDEPDAD